MAAVRAGNMAAAASAESAAVARTKKIRVRVSDDYIKVLLAHPPPEKPARVPTKDAFSSFSAEIQDRFVNRCVKVAGMINKRRDRDMDILAQYHKDQCAYEVLEVEEEALVKFSGKGGVYEEIDA